MSLEEIFLISYARLLGININKALLIIMRPPTGEHMLISWIMHLQSVKTGLAKIIIEVVLKPVSLGYEI